MNTIVLGFKDDRGKGPAVMLAGPEVTGNDQVGMLNKIKQGGKTPEGIVRLEMFNLQSRMIAMPAAKPAAPAPVAKVPEQPAPIVHATQVHAPTPIRAAPTPRLKFNQ